MNMNAKEGQRVNSDQGKGFYNQTQDDEDSRDAQVARHPRFGCVHLGSCQNFSSLRCVTSWTLSWQPLEMQEI